MRVPLATSSTTEASNSLRTRSKHSAYQNECLYDDLTAAEHLVLFAALKGVDFAEGVEAAQLQMEEIHGT